MTLSTFQTSTPTMVTAPRRPGRAHRDDRPRAPNRAGPGAGRWSRNFPENRCQELAQRVGEVSRGPPGHTPVGNGRFLQTRPPCSRPLSAAPEYPCKFLILRNLLHRSPQQIEDLCRRSTIYQEIQGQQTRDTLVGIYTERRRSPLGCPPWSLPPHR